MNHNNKYAYLMLTNILKSIIYVETTAIFKK